MAKLSVENKNVMGLTFAGFGHCIFSSLTTMALPMFFTDVMFINPATVSTIFLVTRLWDAINDPIMGTIVDRTSTRWGKCRPYMLYGAGPLLVLTVLMFMPHSITSEAGKVAYAFITYILFITAFTAIDIPLSGMKPLMFKTPEKRNKATAFIATFGSLGSLLAVDLFFAMVVVFGGGNDRQGYIITVVMLALLACITLLTGFFTTKELVPTTKTKTSVWENYKPVLKNKNLLIAICVTLTTIANSAYGIMLPYFSKWNLADSFSFGNFSVEAVLIPILSTATGIIYMIAIFITPYLLKYLTKKQLFVTCALVGAGLSAVSYFAGYQNFFVFMGLRMLVHIPSSICSSIPGYMIMDCLDYAELKEGKRTEGATYAVNNFMMKAGNAIFSAFMMLVLGLVGYNALITEPALEMGELMTYNYTEMLDGIFMMMTVFPLIGFLIQLIPISFYKLTDKQVVEIASELRARRDESNPISEEVQS